MQSACREIAAAAAAAAWKRAASQRPWPLVYCDAKRAALTALVVYAGTMLLLLLLLLVGPARAPIWRLRVPRCIIGPA